MVAAEWPSLFDVFDRNVGDGLSKFKELRNFGIHEEDLAAGFLIGRRKFVKLPSTPLRFK